MNKKNREEQSRREDQALVRGMLWVVGAIVLEGLLFLLNRYAFDYNTTMESILLAEKLRVVLKALRIVGLVAFVGGAVAAVMQLKKEQDEFARRQEKRKEEDDNIEEEFRREIEELRKLDQCSKPMNDISEEVNSQYSQHDSGQDYNISTSSAIFNDSRN